LKKSKIVFLVLFLFNICFLSANSAHAQNLTETINNLSTNYGQTTADYDLNEDHIVDVYDMTQISQEMGTIDISRIKANYLEIISNEEKPQFESLGISFISDEFFPVTEEGIDLFAYVNAAQGLELEIIEGDSDFNIENDFLYLKPGSYPALAKVKLKNLYAQSEEFYLYGTSDRELHDYTFDYLLKTLSNNA